VKVSIKENLFINVKGEMRFWWIALLEMMYNERQRRKIPKVLTMICRIKLRIKQVVPPRILKLTPNQRICEFCIIYYRPIQRNYKKCGYFVFTTNFLAILVKPRKYILQLYAVYSRLKGEYFQYLFPTSFNHSYCSSSNRFCSYYFKIYNTFDSFILFKS